MSDFLSNVAARALGTAEVVQPRIPSLFEPYRANDGPFVTRTASSFVDATPGSEKPASRTHERHESRTFAGIAMPRTPGAEPFYSHAPTAPQQQAQFPPKDSAEIENPAQPLLSGEKTTHHAWPPQPTQASIAGSAPTIHEHPPLATPSEVSPLAPAQAARPPGTQNSQGLPVPVRAESLSESAPQPVAKPAVRPPRAHAIESTSGGAVPSLRRAVDSSSPLPAPRPPSAESAPAVNEPQARARANEPTANPQKHMPAKPDFTARPDFFTQIPPQESLRRPNTPVQPGQPSPEIRPRTAIEPVVRAPVALRGEAAKTPAELPAASPAEPAIQITIGTVEVRAVFPEKQAPRAPARRPKPGVSLDDYLKQPSRGPR